MLRETQGRDREDLEGREVKARCPERGRDPWEELEMSGGTEPGASLEL